jgi:hypothetical protein
MIGALVLTGCGSGGGGNAGAPSPAPPTTAAPAPDPGPEPAPPAPPDATEPAEPGAGNGGAGGGTWTSGPLTVTHRVAVPPVPRVFGIRSAAHPDEGYDRIVFDIDGKIPGYTVRYVDQVRADPSGLPVDVPGRRYLVITFTPAQAHNDAGRSLVAPQRRTLDHPMMRGYVLVGDFEGYVSVAIGLDDVVGYRVGELPGQPSRVYLDVAA